VFQWVKNERSYNSAPHICLHRVDRENLTITWGRVMEVDVYTAHSGMLVVEAYVYTIYAGRFCTIIFQLHIIPLRYQG
jgi:hypothetical protein